jgi:hypothetical protein
MSIRRTLERRADTLVRRLERFKPSRVRDLTDATELAYLAFVLKDDEKLEKGLAPIGPLTFDGDFNKWSPVELAKALRAWCVRDDQKKGEPLPTRAELRAAGIATERLAGNLLLGPYGRLEKVRQADARGIPRDMFAWRLLLLQELVFLWCVGARRLRRQPPLEAWCNNCIEELRQVVDGAELRDHRS